MRNDDTTVEWSCASSPRLQTPAHFSSAQFSSAQFISYALPWQVDPRYCLPWIVSIKKGRYRVCMYTHTKLHYHVVADQGLLDRYALRARRLSFSSSPSKGRSINQCLLLFRCRRPSLDWYYMYMYMYIYIYKNTPIQTKLLPDTCTQYTTNFSAKDYLQQVTTHRVHSMSPLGTGRSHVVVVGLVLLRPQ